MLPPSVDKDIPPINTTIAQRLKEVAQLLHSQGSNPLRVSSYQHAARTLEQLERPIDDLVQTEGTPIDILAIAEMGEFSDLSLNPDE